MDKSKYVDRTKTFKFKAEENENGGMTMRVAAINKADDYGDRFLPGSFAKNVGRTVPMLPNHIMSENPPLGVAKFSHETQSAAISEMQFNSLPLSQAWRTAAKEHGIEASVRVRMKREDISVRKDGGWDIKKATLKEISLTPMGAQPNTGVVGRVKSEDEAPAQKSEFRVEKSLAQNRLMRRKLSRFAS